MARPRRAIITPEMQKRAQQARVRLYALVTGIALVSVGGLSAARMATSDVEIAAVAQPLPDRTEQTSRWGTRTPLPTPTLAEATSTALPTMTPARTVAPTPSRTPTPTPARTVTATRTPAATLTAPRPAATTTKPAPAGKCPTLVGGGGAKVRALHQTLCARFPAVTTYYGMRADAFPDHPSGKAVDIMVYSNQALGDEIAAYLQANASTLGVDYVIWRQRIWSVDRSSEGWRAMSDRGSNTANHGDHLHCLVK